MPRRSTRLMVIVSITIFAAGALCGGAYRCLTKEPWLTVHRQEDFEFGGAKLRRSVTTESIGVPFLQPETTTLEYRGRIIYKAQRGFQEITPIAQDIHTDGDTISWHDGELKFRLTVEKIPPTTK